MFYNKASKRACKRFHGIIRRPGFYASFIHSVLTDWPDGNRENDMGKYCFLAVFVVSMLFSAQASWAQGKVALKNARVAASIPASLRGKRPVLSASINRKIPIIVQRQTPSVYIPAVPAEVIAARVARAEFLHKQHLARELAKPQFIGQPVSAPSTKLVYRGVELAELKKGDRLVMAGAYDSHKQLVASAHSNLPNGQPILFSESEKSLLAYDVEMVIFVVSHGPARGTEKKNLSFITYYPKTNEISISHN